MKSGSLPEPLRPGTQEYNALQAVFQKRLSNGLQGQVAYTYSKCMTDNGGYYGSWGGAGLVRTHLLAEFV